MTIKFAATMQYPNQHDADRPAPVFDTAWAAWDHLIDERKSHFGMTLPEEIAADRTIVAMTDHALASFNHGVARCWSEVGPLYDPTDGEVLSHLIYSVIAVEIP